ncbi:MAG TPA: DNA topology modulation protein [Pyrinomonadaceae bacterium]|nr:DNA topology modulation protein [Pyrinomonadaceae bacterium]
MRRVLVIGSGGAGKSTFANRLGESLGIEVVHLDSLYWNPGWVETPKQEWSKTIEALLERDSWIIDGNYSGTLELRVQSCDTVIFLDIARTICLWRIIKRKLLFHKKRRPDMAEGCHERLTWEFVQWVWDYPNRARPKVMALLEKYPEGRRIIVLRSSAKAKEFLMKAEG